VKNQLALAGAFALAAVTLLLGGCGTTEDGGSTATSVSSAVTAPRERPTPHRVHRQSRVARHSSSPAALVLGHRTKFTACRIRGLLPDPACTPGAIFTGATVSQICTPGYSRSARNVSESVKQSVYAEYGIASHVPGSYEVDHLVSLELGGNNTVANLWPEISPGYHEKDGIENRLHDAVCAGSVSLRSAQLEIARDWRHTFVAPPAGAGTRATRSAPSTPTNTPPSRTSSATRLALPNKTPSRYSEEAMMVRVLYRQDQDTWVATSPDVPRWTVVADTYAEAHQLAEDGVRFTLERDDLTVEHYVPAGVAVAA
jgi:predicted RNase H-like HicB family nuclease